MRSGSEGGDKKMLRETKCRRCGKKITTMISPIHSSGDTMRKWQGICAGCLSEKEQFEMLLEMREDVKRK